VDRLTKTALEQMEVEQRAARPAARVSIAAAIASGAHQSPAPVDLWDVALALHDNSSPIRN
jgi:hypothetical protein